MARFHIDDPDDPRIAAYRNVPDPELLARHGLFIAEGRLVVRRLLEHRPELAQSVLMTTAALAALADVLEPAGDAGVARPSNHPPGYPPSYVPPIYVVPQHVMNGITGFNMHRGCLAVGRRPQPLCWRDVIGKANTVVVLERVGNPDNVGLTFRNAAAFGAGAVLLGPACADPLYRKTIRTSTGAALSVPFATLTPWPHVLREIADAGFVVIGPTPHQGRPLGDVVRARANVRVALLAGHEGDGLSAEAMANCDDLARIPMAPGVDSLNVATATAVALYACYDARSALFPVNR